ncbi:MAG TPA: hypothetical protein VII61_15310 [Ktedonobacteraceae bacterium]
MYHPICRICQRKLPLNRSLIISNDRRFCKEHYHQYKMRQRNGVITNGLDPQWVDSLDNWRDRPAELAHEIGTKPFSTALFYQQKYENWLLFMRFYITKNGHKTMAGVILSGILQSLHRNKHRATITFTLKKGQKSRSRPQIRMGDALVINTQTGEIRRFVDVSEDIVLDDLQGIRPAPYQEEIAHYWGNSDPTGIEERFDPLSHSKNHLFVISALIPLCTFPVYGLIGKPLGLSSGYRLSWQGDVRHGMGSLSFSFSNPHYPQTHNTLELCSSDPRERNIFYDQEQAIETLFWQYSQEEPEQYSPEKRAQFGAPSIWEGEITIDDISFSGTIHYWSQPEQITLFRLKGEKVILSGHSFGLTYEDLLQVLESAQPINEQDDIIAQYQQAADAEWQHLRAQFIQK